MTPQAAPIAPRYRRYPRPAFTSTVDRQPAIPRALPSTAMIDAVLRLHDQRAPAGGCRVRLSLSDLDKVDAETRALLGETYRRLTDIAIIWDEHEAQIVRVAQAPQPHSVADDEEELMWRMRPSRRAA
ncbi:MAG TPA: hypothetical protein VMU59_09605 [Caulobacteraceae bacterium]|nr:hypothetical protein [Caulobacteraceae bacterium]